MRPDYTPKDSIFPFRGLDYLDPATLVDAHYTPRAQNIMFTKGQCFKRPGYTSLGTTDFSGTNGTVLALPEYEAVDGAKTLIALTTKRQFKWSGSAWTDITGATTVWTGTEDNPIEFVIGQSDQGVLLVATNGVDKPIYWAGSGNFALMESLAGWNYPGGLTFANAVTIYNGFLIFANIKEGATQNPQLVAWSDSSDWAEWLAGTAGAIRPVDTVGPIRKLIILGDRCMVYADDSIGDIVYVGGDIIFASERLVQQTRLISPRAVVDVGAYHFYMDKENIRLYDGTRDTRAIGTPLHSIYRDSINAGYRFRGLGFLDKARNQVYFVVPKDANVQDIYLLEYDTFDSSSNSWTLLNYADRITAMGFFTRTTAETWDDTVNNASWDSDAGIWDQGSSAANFPQRVMGVVTSGGKGSVVLATDSDFNDETVIGGTTITNPVSSSWESIDFTVPQEYLSRLSRWGQIELDLMGDQVEVLYSLDQGATFTSLGTLTLTGSFVKYKLFFDQVSDRCRIKLVNSTSSSVFKLRWLRLWFQPTSEY